MRGSTDRSRFSTPTGRERRVIGRSRGARPVMAASVAAPSCCLAGFCRRLSCRAWLLPSCRYGFSRFGRASNRDWQFQLGVFCSAMVAMVQWLDARSFFFHTLLIVSIFLALALKICRNRFRCHGQSLAELSPSRLCNSALCPHFSISALAAVSLASVPLCTPSDSKSSFSNNLRD